MTTLSLASILAEAARRVPDKIAVVDGDLRLTYADAVARRRAQYAAAPAAARRRPGDKVALLAPNVADFPRAYYGILAAGGVVVPVPRCSTPSEAAYVLRHSGAAGRAAPRVRAPTSPAGRRGPPACPRWDIAEPRRRGRRAAARRTRPARPRTPR